MINLVNSTKRPESAAVAGERIALPESCGTPGEWNTTPCRSWIDCRFNRLIRSVAVEAQRGLARRLSVDRAGQVNRSQTLTAPRKLCLLAANNAPLILPRQSKYRFVQQRLPSQPCKVGREASSAHELDQGLRELALRGS